MKRIVIYCAILALLYLVPVNGQNVADMEPIQAVWLTYAEDQLQLITDTGDIGSGATVAEALADMKDKSLGIVYLETAQYLLVSEKAQNVIMQIKPYLKGKVKVCLWEGNRVEDAAKYMQAHRIGIQLRKWEANVKLPKLPI